MSKFEKDFKEWYEKEPQYLNSQLFSGLPFMYQWGVYLMFLKTIDLIPFKTDHNRNEYRVYYKKYGVWEYYTLYNPNMSDEQAQEEAINKAKEIYEGL